MNNKYLHFLFSIFLHFWVIFFFNKLYCVKNFNQKSVKINFINFNNEDKNHKNVLKKHLKKNSSKEIFTEKSIDDKSFSKDTEKLNKNIKDIINEKYKNLEILNDERDFDLTNVSELDNYLKDVIKKIYEKKFYPNIARFRRNEGEVKIIFTILKTGEVLNLGLFKSSGYKILDETAINIIKSVEFEQFSHQISLDMLKLKINFVFSLK